MQSTSRVELHKLLTKEMPFVEFTKGKNKGKIGKVVRVGHIRNGGYRGGHYNNYFDLTIDVEGRKMYTSCNNIEPLIEEVVAWLQKLLKA